MVIRAWGVRGSIPVSGKQFSIYGGDTTCIEIQSQTGDTVIIDAGTGLRACGRSLVKKNVTKVHLIMTHFHLDHLIGFPYFWLLYNSAAKITIWGPASTAKKLETKFSNLMKPPYFPKKLSDLPAQLVFKPLTRKSFKIGGLSVSTIALSHPDGCIGYAIKEDSKTFVFLTDNEIQYPHPGADSYEKLVKFSQNADLLFHDTEFSTREYPKKSGWGHSDVRSVSHLAKSANVRSLGLIHHHQSRSDSGVQKLEHQCKREMANTATRVQAIKQGQKIII